MQRCKKIIFSFVSVYNLNLVNIRHFLLCLVESNCGYIYTACFQKQDSKGVDLFSFDEFKVLTTELIFSFRNISYVETRLNIQHPLNRQLTTSVNSLKAS